MRIGPHLLFVLSGILAGSPVAVFAQGPPLPNTAGEPPLSPATGTTNPSPPKTDLDHPSVGGAPPTQGAPAPLFNPCDRPKEERPNYCDIKQ
jgi:hypothetical protein